MTPQLSPSETETEQHSRPRQPGAPGDPPGDRPVVGRHRQPAPRGIVPDPTRRWSYLLAGGAYLALSLILWWHVLPHPRTRHHLRMR